MKSIQSGKFIMLAITCIMFGDLSPMYPYRNAIIQCNTERQARDVERYAYRIGLELKPVHHIREVMTLE